MCTGKSAFLFVCVKVGLAEDCTEGTDVESIIQK